jgi:hypothetical protein
MNTNALYRSLKLAAQKFELEACFAKPGHDSKVERVVQEIHHLFASEDLQHRLREKRGWV